MPFACQVYAEKFWQDKFLQVCLRPQEFQINLMSKNTTHKVLSNMVKADDTYVRSLGVTTPVYGSTVV